MVYVFIPWGEVLSLSAVGPAPVTTETIKEGGSE